MCRYVNENLYFSSEGVNSINNLRLQEDIIYYVWQKFFDVLIIWQCYGTGTIEVFQKFVWNPTGIILHTKRVSAI